MTMKPMSVNTTEAARKARWTLGRGKRETTSCVAVQGESLCAYKDTRLMHKCTYVRARKGVLNPTTKWPLTYLKPLSFDIRGSSVASVEDGRSSQQEPRP